MAFLEFTNVRIAGFSAGVPKQIERNDDLTVSSTEYDAKAFVELTGVAEKRVSKTLTTSDLCYGAAEQLISDLKWDKDEIEAIIFVSQTPDYILPATACILQDRLKLSKECYASDISLGCSGWVYGLSSLVSLMANGGIKKSLLMVGDAKSRVKDVSLRRDPLFGHAGTVTALEYKEGEKGFQFHFGTDGSGYDAIITPAGGSRIPVSAESFVPKEVDGKMLADVQSRMKGMDVFSFGITTAPKSVKKIAKKFGFDYSEYDYFVFHQANMKMNNMIKKKLNLPDEKVPSCMAHFGNTSSASIPLAIVTELKGKVETKPTKFLCCGFGVGLSWGTVVFDTNNIVISDLQEL